MPAKTSFRFFSKKALLFAALFAATAFTLTATPVGWSIDLTVSGGGLAGHYSGTLVYDASTQAISYWNIPIGLGFNTPAVCTSGYLPACLQESVTVSGDTFDFNVFQLSQDLSETLTLDFVTPLTDAGGVVDLVPGSINGGSMLQTPGGTWAVSGSAFTPEPTTGGLLTLALVATALEWLFTRMRTALK